ADGVAIVIGIVIGSAIFETPALVAANAGSAANIMAVWLLGALISVIGALCYAELASAYPDAGGDYHYLHRAWGRNPSFLYGWARITVIQTGSIALIAFVFGDYASQIYRLGAHSPAIYAAAAVISLTTIHLIGVRSSRAGQRLMTAVQIAGLILLIASAAFVQRIDEPMARLEPMSASGFGLAMVFVLLSYGGWNEAAFVSAELYNPRRNVIRVLLLSIGIIASIYLLLNVAMIYGLGTDGMAGSQAVAADLIRLVAGDRGAVLVSLLVVACALASIHAMIFTGARTTYALGRDFRLLSALGRWREGGSVPVNALLLQLAIIILLIVFGAVQRRGFETMVDYSAPVFWLFFLLTTLSLIRLRRKDPAPRPFAVPLYPLTPILFAIVCAYLLYSSIMYTGIGSMVGLAVVCTGIPVLWMCRRST
ncbi:MAG TPA: amino acid permease, partial [Thermoanaerobaculia bacterium]|nr:amino acid permease [Thermoanaerobaculia bacterium]